MNKTLQKIQNICMVLVCVITAIMLLALILFVNILPLLLGFDLWIVVFLYAAIFVMDLFVVILTIHVYLETYGETTQG